MRRLPIIALLVLVAGCLMPGCSDNDCDLVTNSMARFIIADQNGNPLKFTTNISVSAMTQADVKKEVTQPDGSIKEVIVYDSLIVDTLINQEAVEGFFSIPLSYNEYTSYVIHYDEKLRDTIKVEHEPRPYFTDLDCGALTFYTVKGISYTSHMLDSVIITNAEIDNYEKENFRIYYTAQ